MKHGGGRKITWVFDVRRSGRGEHRRSMWMPSNICGIVESKEPRPQEISGIYMAILKWPRTRLQEEGWCFRKTTWRNPSIIIPVLTYKMQSTVYNKYRTIQSRTLSMQYFEQQKCLFQLIQLNWMNQDNYVSLPWPWAIILLPNVPSPIYQGT